MSKQHTVSNIRSSIRSSRLLDTPCLTRWTPYQEGTRNAVTADETRPGIRKCGLALVIGFVISASVPACAPTASPQGAPTTFGETSSSAVQLKDLTAEAYARTKDSKGTVLLAVNWNRNYRCKGADFAQLQNLAFERMPVTERAKKKHPDLLLDDAPRLLTKPGFDSYVFMVAPGIYALTGFEIKVWESAMRVAKIMGTYTQLVKDDKPVGGTFDVQAGEIIYIGHFWLDCQNAPTAVPLRQYLNGRAPFERYLAQVKTMYPFLEVDKAQFRLFRTELFGIDFELPEAQSKE